MGHRQQRAVEGEDSRLGVVFAHRVRRQSLCDDRGDRESDQAVGRMRRWPRRRARWFGGGPGGGPGRSVWAAATGAAPAPFLAGSVEPHRRAEEASQGPAKRRRRSTGQAADRRAKENAQGAAGRGRSAPAPPTATGHDPAGGRGRTAKAQRHSEETIGRIAENDSRQSSTKFSTPNRRANCRR